MRDRHPKETVSAYELRRCASTCEYIDLETQLRDRLECGINNETLYIGDITPRLVRVS